MKAIDKVTKRIHSACPVLCGYQVCLIPGVEWENAETHQIHVFTNEEFYVRFELKGETICQN